MVSAFVVLIFIPATEHASENLSRACWRPFWVESSCARSSANNRRCTVHSPIFTLPCQVCIYLLKKSLVLLLGGLQPGCTCASVYFHSAGQEGRRRFIEWEVTTRDRGLKTSLGLET